MDLQTPTNKMSKSEIADGGCVLILDKPEDIIRMFKRAVTDSETTIRFDPNNKPGISNLMQIYSVCTGKRFDEIENEFSGQGYGVFKQQTGEAVIEVLRPVREEAQRLLADKAYLESVYSHGAEKASRTASKTLSKVYKKIGFIELRG